MSVNIPTFSEFNGVPKSIISETVPVTPKDNKTTDVSGNARQMLGRSMRADQSKASLELFSEIGKQEQFLPYTEALKMVEGHFTNEKGAVTYPVLEVPSLVYLSVLDALCEKILETERDPVRVRTLYTVRIAVNRSTMHAVSKVDSPKTVLEELLSEKEMLEEMHTDKKPMRFIDAEVGWVPSDKVNIPFSSELEKKSFGIFMDAVDKSVGELRGQVPRNREVIIQQEPPRDKFSIAG